MKRVPLRSSCETRESKMPTSRNVVQSCCQRPRYTVLRYVPAVRAGVRVQMSAYDVPVACFEIQIVVKSQRFSGTDNLRATRMSHHGSGNG